MASENSSNFLKLGGSTFYSMLLSIVSSFFLMNFLSPNQFGIISQIYMGVNVFSLFSFSFISTANFEVPKHKIENNHEDLREVITSTFIMSYILCLPIASAYVFYKFLMYGCTTQEWMTYTCFLFLLFLRQTQMCLTNIYLRGWKLFALLSKAQWISYTLSYALMILTAAYFHFYFVLLSLLAYRIFFNLYVVMNIDFVPLKRVSKKIWKSMFQKSTPLFFNDSIAMLASYSNQIILTIGMSQFAAQRSMALYNNGLRVQEVLLKISFVTYSIFMVNFKEFYTLHSKKLLFEETKKYTQLLGAFCPWLCVCGISSYQYLSTLLLPSFYEQSFITLKFLSWSSTIMLVTLFYSIFLTAIEHLWIKSIANILSTLSMIICTYVAIKNNQSISWIAFYTCIITALHFGFIAIYSYVTSGFSLLLGTIETIRLYMPCIILFFSEYYLWKSYPLSASINSSFTLVIHLFLFTLLSFFCATIFNRSGLKFGFQKIKLKFNF